MAKYQTAIPDPDSGWTLFSGKKPVKTGRDLHEAVAGKPGILIGVPVSRAPSFAITVPTTDSSLLRQMAYAQIEKRGLSAGSIDKTVFDYDIVDQRNERTIMAVHVLENPLPEDFILNNAAGYAPSPQVRQRVDEGAVLWKENRQLALAIFTGGRLIHSQVLSGAPELSAATAAEINLLLLSIQGDPAFEFFLPTRIAVNLEDVDAQAKKAFSEKLQLDVAFTDSQGACKKAHPRPGLLPPEIVRYRRSRKNARWIGIGAVVLLVGYFFYGAHMWKRAKSNQETIASLERQIELIEPDVLKIQEIENRWREMEPAFDLKWFPVVQLSRITRALPGSGVVIREYQTRGRDIYIQGQARDVQLAFRLEEDLSNMDEFSHYDWTMPKPSMNNDNTATFRIEGKPIEQ